VATTKKVSLAIGADELAWAKERARRGKSLSSVVTEALRTARRLDARKEMIAWLFEGRPAPTEAELANLRAEWDSRSTPAR
jgi:hypothetical protein